MNEGTQTKAGSGTVAAVKLFGSGQTVEVAQRDFAEIYPGEFVCPAPPKFTPKVGIVKLIRVEGGLYQAVIRALPLLVAASEWKPEVYGCGWKSAVRLALAGFIKYERPVPGRIVVDVESFFEHRARVRREANFWNLERRAQLASADDDLARMRHDLEPEDDELTDQQTEMKL
jgi:hypothetical protein